MAGRVRPGEEREDREEKGDRHIEEEQMIEWRAWMTNWKRDVAGWKKDKRGSGWKSEDKRATSGIEATVETSVKQVEEIMVGTSNLLTYEQLPGKSHLLS
jgi:hypothetical protein